MNIPLKTQNKPLILLFSIVMGGIFFTSVRGVYKFDDIIALDDYYESAVFIGMLSIINLVISELVPSKLKLILVYWRFKNPTPSSKAFSEIMYNDYRIDTDVLQKNYGKFPLEPAKQDKKFYQIYKPIQNDMGIMDAHKSYLLFRELTVISAVALFLGSIFAYIFSLSIFAAFVFFSVSLIFYFIFSLTAQRAGYRFVSNTLAVASVEIKPAQSS